MKKKIAAILTCGIMVGLLFLGMAEYRPETTAADSGGIAEAPKVALTFDDGPHPKYTAMLLDGLQERGVQVTFFVTGEHAEAYPELIERMQQEGHLIGNHTYSHIRLTEDNKEQFAAELLQTNEVIAKITGEEVLYVRPPYGLWDKGLEQQLALFPVLWSVDPLDWCTSDAAAVTKRVVRNTKENSVILLHDCYRSSVQAALQIVDCLQEAGYRFVTVDELYFE